ncbi:MAG: hypothetical protein AB1540_02035 [Bdellovibrionota bacterium]
MKKNQQRGQGLIEYVALTALVAIVSIGTVKLFGSKVRSRLNQVANTFDRNVKQGLKQRPMSSESQEETEDGGSRLPKGIRLPGGVPIPRF